MIIVLDTNVLFSATRSPNGPAAEVMKRVATGRLRLAFNDAMVSEYREVLARAFDVSLVTAVVDAIVAEGLALVPVSYAGALPDECDRPFIEVARHVDVVAVVTRNLRDFPEGLGFEVLTPEALLTRLRAVEKARA